MTKELWEVEYDGITYIAEVTPQTIQGKDGSLYTSYSVSIKVGDVTLTSSFYQTVGMAISELIPWGQSRPRQITTTADKL